MYIEWKEEYATGVPRIDEQHQQLVHLLDDLYQQIGPNTETSVVLDHLHRFNQYADAHFSTEENLASVGGVTNADVAAHRKHHEAYRQRMLKFRLDLQAKDKRTATQLLAFLSQWWISHILVEDHALTAKMRK